MPSTFHVFGKAVRARFNQLATADRLFVVDSDRDEIWTKYIASFPEGTNPIFRNRTEHDCACCRHFIRSVGNIVRIKQDGTLDTVWDVTDMPGGYQVVADAMAAYIRSCKIRDVFYTKFPKAGEEKTKEIDAAGKTINWDHFSAVVPKKFVCEDVGTKQGEARTGFDTLKRAVEELTPESVQTVLDLINENNLYRGEEHKRTVVSFQEAQTKLRGKSDPLFWNSLDNKAAVHIRNSSIGTLLINLSAGMEVENAVKAFEAVVAPSNYKRPTAIVTKAMAEAALKTIKELDVENAVLHRRHAKLSDVSVNNVLWVDNSVKGKMKGGVEGLLMAEVKPAPFDPSKAKPIKIDEFLKLNHKQGIKVYFDNPLASNLVSMTAPVHDEKKQIFLWGNDFAWSYNGDVADSIKERVKRAGGQVEGVALRCSLAWHNLDDLDLHCVSPEGRLSWENARPRILDVDMNANGPSSRTPVENMRWKTPRDGRYQFMVHNFNRREVIDIGFTIEVESALGLHSYQYSKSVEHKQMVEVCQVMVKNGQVVEIDHAPYVVAGQSSQTVWGLKTLDLVKVQSIVNSPNYWTEPGCGNKHWFFILEGCRNPTECRGIFNEYLHPRLAKHRKAFETIGARSKCPVADEQLSGVGFSSTRKDKVIAVSSGIAYEISF